MKPRILRRTQVARVAACAVLLNFSVPGGAIAVYGTPLRESAAKRLEDRAREAKAMDLRRAKSASRLLTTKEKRSIQGRSGENPYLAGQSKWDVAYKGINLMTGNYSTYANDLSFDGGYGIPVNVTRSYSANNPDEGPFGKGWTLSADVRSTAGGLVKSAGAPVNNVPTTLKERSSREDDPNVATEPAAAVTAIDAGGTAETIQKDVDGILTTPAWDKNVYDSQYEWVEFPAGSGVKTQLLVSNTVKTPEGTAYTYAKQGSYPNGTTAYGNPNAAPEAANVLKVTSATDRHGNVTTYAYGNTPRTFQKSNGTVSEKPLVGVAMPGGHTIAFTWGDGSAGHPANRVWKVSDNDAVRTVVYDYTAGGLLWRVTTPGLKTTTYGYGAPYSGGSADLLRSITDPRGLTTSIAYLFGPTAPDSGGYPTPGASSAAGVFAYKVTAPNGLRTYFRTSAMTLPANDNPWTPSTPLPCLSEFREYADASSDLANRGCVGVYYDADASLYRVALGRDYNVGTSQPSGGQFAVGADWVKSYGVQDQNLMEELHSVYQVPTATGSSADLRSARAMPTQGYSALQTLVTKAYNFMGAPLSTTVTERTVTNGGSTVTVGRIASVDYAYWGADRYYQQKATRDQAGRIAYTEYYPSTDGNVGRRGGTSRVFDAKYTPYVVDSSLPAPALAAGQTQADYDAKVWKYRLRPSNDSDAGCAARFEYDAQGRPTDVWKLQKAPSNASRTYVQTHTEYGGAWGQASQVVEDYGGIGRTTRTLGYTSWGKPCDVIDAAGHEFVTAFDKDGLVLSVTQADNGGGMVASYAYGTSGVSNGQPTTVTDGLSGVVQSIDYTPSGGGVGQPAAVTETNGSDSYRMAYTYGPLGDRATVTQTDNGTPVAKWGYGDYLPVGDPTAAGRPFQTLARLDAAGSRTTEEFHYAYDSTGRLTAAAFAQTAQAGSPTAKGYYDGKLAQSRARTAYSFDGGGRLVDVSTYWDTANAQGTAYGTSTLVAQNACGYETSANGTGLNRGLKTSSLVAMQGDGTRTETYGYDPKNDQLTEAHYGDGAQAQGGYPYPDESWSYDAAGNRSGNVVDNLNRATTAGGLACTSDVLGNQTSKTNAEGRTFFYTWDALNRLTAHGRSGAWSASYGYRADGMRVSKLYNGVATRYRHDGQTAIEDVEQPVTGNATITRYGLGARGVDFMEQTSPNGAVTKGFPIYDAHGNNVATLYRNGSGYAVQNLRRYSAWGNVRGGAPTDGPKGSPARAWGTVRTTSRGWCTCGRGTTIPSRDGS